MSARTPEPFDRDEFRDLRILEEVERNPSVSQRELAASLGVALSITNACVHALVRKGMIKITGENNRSITYHLTKKGVVHKALLAVEWTRNTVDFYRQARGFVSGELSALTAAGAHRVVIYGSGDLAEITLIAASDFALDVIGVVGDPSERTRERIATLPVSGLDELAAMEPDAVIVALDGLDVDRVSALLSAARSRGADPIILPVADRQGFAALLAQADPTRKQHSARTRR